MMTDVTVLCLFMFCCLVHVDLAGEVYHIRCSATEVCRLMYTCVSSALMYLVQKRHVGE
jgi:hypothetical protein